MHRVNFEPPAAKRSSVLLLIAAIAWTGAAAFASTPDGAEKSATTPTEEKEKEKQATKVEVEYDEGLRVRTENDSFSLHLQVRGQFRYSNQDSEEHPNPEDFVDEEEGFRIQRARIKFGGHAYRKWLKYYTEIELATPRLLTMRFTVQPKPTIGLRVGQFKVLYNRERLDSSGKLQFADRSIVTSPFTLDRQQGLTVLGRLFPGKVADSEYAFGVFTGTGRGGGLDDDSRPMYTGRWQWNFLRRPTRRFAAGTSSTSGPA